MHKQKGARRNIFECLFRQKCYVTRKIIYICLLSLDHVSLPRKLCYVITSNNDYSVAHNKQNDMGMQHSTNNNCSRINEK